MFEHAVMGIAGSEGDDPHRAARRGRFRRFGTRPPDSGNRPEPARHSGRNLKGAPQALLGSPLPAAGPPDMCAWIVRSGWRAPFSLPIAGRGSDRKRSGLERLVTRPDRRVVGEQIAVDSASSLRFRRRMRRGERGRRRSQVRTRLAVRHSAVLSLGPLCPKAAINGERKWFNARPVRGLSHPDCQKAKVSPCTARMKRAASGLPTALQ